ncbi:MAG: hypothetical protein JXD21_04555 [Candidatus Omnitrophica bacterium]|nr:hypothetical protein [Candidatus Omnitrophota bacterium]
MKYVFLTQGSQAVGYGHVYEALAIAETLSSPADFILFDSSDIAETIVRQKGYNRIKRLTMDTLDTCDISRETCVVLDTRLNDIVLQKKIRTHAGRLIMIDELGDKKVDCDVLINFSICKEWVSSYRYEKEPHCFFGAQYYPLREEFLSLPKKDKGHPVKRVLISMGGADRTRATLKIAESCASIEGCEFTYIVGGGFEFGLDEIKTCTGNRKKHHIIKDSSDFAGILNSHDMIITAGGNTLFEAAFCGVPSLVVWEDEHERVQGEAFEQYGVARVIGNAGGFSAEQLRNTIEKVLSNPAVLKKMSDTGKKLVDGNGCERITHILRGVKNVSV